MASLRKRGNVWRVEVVKKVDGVTVRRSATKNTKAEAIAWGVQTEADLLRNEHPVSANGKKITLNDVIDAYIEKRAQGKRGGRWEIVRCKKMQRELGFVGKSIDAIAPSEIADWRDASIESGLAGASVIREMTLLSSIFEFAKKEKGWVRTNPVRNVKRPPGSEPRHRLISKEERNQILDSLGYTYGLPPARRKHFVALAFLLAIETGARAGEILKLRWAFVDYERKVARITRGTKNGDAWRDLPLSNEAIRILKLCREGVPDNQEMCFPLSSGCLDTMFRRARDNCGIKDLHFHDTRHQAATNLSRKLSVLQLAKTLGHRTLKHIMVYYNEDMADIAKKL